MRDLGGGGVTVVLCHLWWLRKVVFLSVVWPTASCTLEKWILDSILISVVMVDGRNPKQPPGMFLKPCK